MDVFAACPFAPYGLDASWTGPRTVAGWGSHDGVVDWLELAHGAPDGPNVRVGTGVDLRDAARRLAEALWAATGVHVEAMRAPYGEADPTAGWEDSAIAVDGVPRPFRVLRVGGTWVAVGPVRVPGGEAAGTAGEPVAAIEARGVALAAVRLVRVADPGAYEAGA